MIRFRRTLPAPPPLVAPQVNARAAVLVDGARYGGRVDDIVEGGIVIAAPDAHLAPERPVLVEWRDAAGLWQMPAEVVHSRLHPFPTTTVRPTGTSECVQSTAGNGAAGLRVSARVIASTRLPEGTRVPVTTINLRGDRLALWTILPVERGDQLECVASLPDGRLVRARCTVEIVQAHQGTWLVRAECVLEEPASPAVRALVSTLVSSGDTGLRAA
jgi:hypothetical protein